MSSNLQIEKKNCINYLECITGLYFTKYKYPKEMRLLGFYPIKEAAKSLPSFCSICLFPIFYLD